MPTVNYIDEKEMLLHKMLENTKTQTQAIETDNLKILEALIGQRAEIMQQVDKLDQQVASSAEELPKGQPETIKDILTQIITIDKVNQGLMQKGMEDTGKDLADIKAEIRTIRERRQQEAGYAPEYGIYKEEGIFFDTKE